MKMNPGMDAALLQSRAVGDQQRVTRAGDENPAKEFEALLIRKVVEAMRKTIPESEMGQSGRQMHDYLVEESLTQALSSGRGLGLSRMFPGGNENAGPTTVQSLGGAGGPMDRGMERMSWSTSSPLSAVEESLQPRSSEPTGVNQLESVLTGRPKLSLADQLPPSRDAWGADEVEKENRLMSILLGEERP